MDDEYEIVNANFQPVEAPCIVVLMKGQVQHVLEVGEDVQLYRFECAQCHETVNIVMNSDISPSLCPCCGAEFDSDEDEDWDGDDDYEEDENQ